MTREEKIEELEEVQRLLINQFNILADILDFYKNKKKYEQAFNYFVKNPDIKIFENIKNGKKFGLDDRELFFFKGLMFINSAIGILEDYVDDKIIDIDFIKTFTTSVFWGTSISAWSISKIDIDKLEHKNNYATLVSRIDEIQHFPSKILGKKGIENRYKKMNIQKNKFEELAKEEWKKAITENRRPLDHREMRDYLISQQNEDIDFSLIKTEPRLKILRDVAREVEELFGLEKDTLIYNPGKK